MKKTASPTDEVLLTANIDMLLLGPGYSQLSVYMIVDVAVPFNTISAKHFASLLLIVETFPL